MSTVDKFKNVKTFVTSKVARQVLKGQKHSPEILFVAGTVGVVVGTVMACRATLKLESVNREHNHNLGLAKDLYDTDADTYTTQDYRKDVTKLYTRRILDTTKLYGPAFTVGALSICALGGSHLILSKRNAGLVAAYAALDKGFGEYRDRVSEFVGADKELELRHGSQTREIVEDGKNGPKVKTVTTVSGPSIYARFFDPTCGPWEPRPEYNMIFLNAQQRYANDMLLARGHVFLNEVYDSLGMERTKAGAVVGWIFKKDETNFVDFGLHAGSERSRAFINGTEASILLDFNVDGTIFDKI